MPVAAVEVALIVSVPLTAPTPPETIAPVPLADVASTVRLLLPSVVESPPTDAPVPFTEIAEMARLLPVRFTVNPLRSIAVPFVDVAVSVTPLIFSTDRP